LNPPGRVGLLVVVVALTGASEGESGRERAPAREPGGLPEGTAAATFFASVGVDAQQVAKASSGRDPLRQGFAQDMVGDSFAASYCEA
jgi:hypothetical protein